MNKILSLLLLLFIFTSCGNNSSQKYTDTTTSGNILILVDESYQPVIQVQIDTFQDIYKNAKIDVRYLPESELMKQLVSNDSVRIAIAGRDLYENEKIAFENMKIIPRSLKVASDAIALIVNKDNPDTVLTYDQLTKIFRSEISTWNSVSGKNNKDSIVVVFDKSGSANARYLKEKFLGEANFSGNFFAANSNSAVRDYVSKNNSAIGVIGVNWISDRDDSTAQSWLNSFKVVGVTASDSAGDNSYYQPYQAYIALKKYPLTRDMYIINREGRNGLGTGFASFVAGDKGQRLFRLSGLLPATMPVRLIQVN